MTGQNQLLFIFTFEAKATISASPRVKYRIPLCPVPRLLLCKTLLNIMLFLIPTEPLQHGPETIHDPPQSVLAFGLHHGNLGMGLTLRFSNERSFKS